MERQQQSQLRRVFVGLVVVILIGFAGLYYGVTSFERGQIISAQQNVTNVISENVTHYTNTASKVVNATVTTTQTATQTTTATTNFTITQTSTRFQQTTTTTVVNTLAQTCTVAPSADFILFIVSQKGGVLNIWTWPYLDFKGANVTMHQGAYTTSTIYGDYSKLRLNGNTATTGTISYNGTVSTYSFTTPNINTCQQYNPTLAFLFPKP